MMKAPPEQDAGPEPGHACGFPFSRNVRFLRLAAGTQTTHIATWTADIAWGKLRVFAGIAPIPGRDGTPAFGCQRT